MSDTPSSGASPTPEDPEKVALRKAAKAEKEAAKAAKVAKALAKQEKEKAAKDAKDAKDKAAKEATDKSGVAESSSPAVRRSKTCFLYASMVLNVSPFQFEAFFYHFVS